MYNKVIQNTEWFKRLLKKKKKIRPHYKLYLCNVAKNC
jgi:hypothetical protein